VTHDLREFRFVSLQGSVFLPGQYAMLDLPGLTASRAYSMSNTANERGEWHFQIRRVPHGLGTHTLFDRLAVGDEIGLDGPYGVAFLRSDSPRDIVCVAGGSGLAPMISIARGAAEAGLIGERKLYFFYGARTPRDVCGEEMLRALPGFGERIRFIPVVSLPGEDGHWTGATGYVHDQLERVLPERMAEYEFYFAGPPPMTQAIQELLMVGHQVPFGQIHFDRFF
jgi:toluene monooxygenase electron transfer component